MKRYFIGIALAFVFPMLAFSQSGRVTILMDEAANRAINAVNSESKIQGYRICIFSDNSQTGRAAAHAAVSQLHAILPGIPSEVIYENPFFRAYAGSCLNKIEATQLLGRLRSTFPRAIIVGKEFLVSSFLSAPQQVVAMDSIGN